MLKEWSRTKNFYLVSLIVQQILFLKGILYHHLVLFIWSNQLLLIYYDFQCIHNPATSCSETLTLSNWELSYFLVSFYIRINWLIIKTLSIDYNIIINNSTFWLVIFSSCESFSNGMVVWMSQHKQSDNCYKIWFQKISILISSIFFFRCFFFQILYLEVLIFFIVFC